MAGEMFGAPVGISNAIADEHTLAQTELTRGQTSLIPGQLAMQPIQQMQMLAHGRLYNAEAGQKENDLAMNQALAGAVKSMGIKTVGDDGKPLPYSQVLSSMGDMAMRSGAINKATEFQKQAVGMAGHEARVQQNEVMLYSAQNKQKHLDLGNVISGMALVNDQAGLDQLNQNFISKFKEQPPWAGLQASGMPVEDIKKAVQTYGTTAQQQLAREDRLSRQEAVNGARDKAIEIRQQQLELNTQKTQITKEKAVQTAKIGGKVIGMPSKEEVNNVLEMLTKDQPNAVSNSPDDAKAFANSIAQQAKADRTNNPGLTPELAMFKVYQERKDDFLVTPPPDNSIFDYLKSRKTTGEYSSPATAAPISMNQGAKNYVDLKSLKENKWYNVDGTVARRVKKDGKMVWMVPN